MLTSKLYYMIAKTWQYTTIVLFSDFYYWILCFLYNGYFQSSLNIHQPPICGNKSCFGYNFQRTDTKQIMRKPKLTYKDKNLLCKIL